MNQISEDFLTIGEETDQEKELLSLDPMFKDLDVQIYCLSLNESKNFYGELVTRIRSLIYNCVKAPPSNNCSQIHRYLYLFFQLYAKLSKVSFMNPEFLINFLFSRIFPFYNSINPEEINDINAINEGIINLCKDQLKPVVYHSINFLVNKFIFQDPKNSAEIYRIIEFFQVKKESIDISSIKDEIADIFFMQLICLDDFTDNQNKNMLKDTNKVKEFIENSILQLYQLNMEKDENQNEGNIVEDHDTKEDIFLSLFKNDFNKETRHLLRHLRKAIIKVFTPVDSNILDFFEFNIKTYYAQNKDLSNKGNTKDTGTKLDQLGNHLLENNIQDVDIKIRNISFLIDIILQKYFNIQNIPELALMKFPRINIIMNRLYMDKNPYIHYSQENLINAIFEHFILSQFILNYIKYQIKDPEHYPLEIRYFTIFSYLNLSESYLKTNPFSSYITAITFKEIINFLKLQNGFQKQKYMKYAAQLNNSNDSNLNDSSLDQSLNKSSARKSQKRKSISRRKNNKKKNKKKSIKKSENPKEKINYNIDVNLIETYSKLGNDSNSQSRQNNSKIISNNEEKLDQPEKVLSKTLFNYFCFIYSMAYKYKTLSEYFNDLYSFIDEYIEDNMKTLSFDDDWTWLLIEALKFIKNFSLRKSFEKFEIKVDQNDVATKVKLIAYLSKKVKYCNTQEHFLILDVIYNILINMNDLPNVLKSPKFSDKFKKLNRALSYLSFNVNYSMNSSEDITFIDKEIVGDKLFKITNLLFKDSLDEYFWIPKNLNSYKKLNDFIFILESLFNKVLYKKSLYSEFFLYGLVALKKYINKLNPKSKNKSKKEREKEQYILALEYFCKFPIPTVNNIQDLKKESTIKTKIIEFMELMPDVYDFQYDLNDKLDLIKNILLSGEYDLRVLLFIIFQLITHKKLQKDSQEIKLINEVFKIMNNKHYKFTINFLLTLYKSIEKYLFDLIDRYVELNFPENYNFSKKEYNKFVDYFNTGKSLVQDNPEGKDIQIIYNNWTLITNDLDENDVLYGFLERAEEHNYPKSVMNIIEKHIFDIKRQFNIHNFFELNNRIKYDEKFGKKIKKYLELYYKAYSHIEDNRIILENYFNENNESLIFIGKNDKNLSRPTICQTDDNNSIDASGIINDVNQFFITLDANLLSNNIQLIEKLRKQVDTNYIYSILIYFFYNIYNLNKESLDIEKRKFIFSSLKIKAKNLILEVLSYNNRFGEKNSMNLSLWLYEISLYLEQFESYISQCKNSCDFFNNIINLSRKLRNIFINKRKIPHLKRFLLIFYFRRFLFNLFRDKVSELYCLMDICKVYKTIYETGISSTEKNDFRKILSIYMNNLLKIENEILINIDKKLFFVPLKYCVKFFPDNKSLHFEDVYQKYINLYNQNNKDEFLSYKIIILSLKLKAKRGAIDINENLTDKIKILENNINNHNSKEGFIIYTDYYLDRLLNNKNDFKSIEPRESIKRIQIYDINENIFKYLKGAINICIKTDKEKYLRKYMPEIINLFFKINLSINNSTSDRNISQSQSQTIIENDDKYRRLLDKFKKEVSINKVKIIIPQLIICYQYEKTKLYNFAIELLAFYANQNIDLIAFLLSSFLNFKEEDLKSIGIKTYKHDSHNYNKYSNTFTKSKNFVNAIKDRLSQKNKKILMGYEEFCQNLSELYFESKRMSNQNKKDIRAKQAIYINNVNMSLMNNDIILPTLENLNGYNPSVRTNDNNNNILFLKELDPKIEILSSKEKPMHIRFKTRNIKGDISPRKFYDFLLKCDVNDITKEIKTFEIIDEINNIFKMKHYDTNESMSLKRYLIVPIAPTIILAEWLNDCISFSSVIEEQYKKDLIYQEEYKSIIDSQNNKPYIKPGSIVNEEEKFNVLYNYYQYNFFDPNLWYSAKKKYIISTAIWSMTQYLVGLGDRHPGNIMFNKKDGEVVHIDFGYVALKGLSLGVPEIVQFRLTLNLRKNLGLFDENGLFNYICEKTLKTFKEYYKTLSARIEYYQFDPLFDSENDNKTFDLFNQNENFFNRIDDRNIKDNLKELIDKNTNPENLEKMYIWWSPWV